jgi:hypothetical protein
MDVFLVSASDIAMIGTTRVHNLFQLLNNALERDFSGIQMRHKHEIFKRQDKTFRNQSHYYCGLHHMFNTPYHYCQLWGPKSCRQKTLLLLPTRAPTSNANRTAAFIYMFVHTSECE